MVASGVTGLEKDNSFYTYPTQLVDAFVKASFNVHGYRTSAEWELERRRAFVKTTDNFFKNLHIADDRNLLARTFKTSGLLVGLGDVNHSIRLCTSRIPSTTIELTAFIFRQEKIGFLSTEGGISGRYNILQRVTNYDGQESKMRVEYYLGDYITKNKEKHPLIVTDLGWSDLKEW